MKLSKPVHILKRDAKALKRSRGISMIDALDQMAKTEGFSSWSLLQSKLKTLIPKTQEEVLGYLNPGDLLLVGARPGLGKTSVTLKVLSQAVREGRRCFFFSFEYTHRTFAAKIVNLGETIDELPSLLTYDFSDEISADYIIRETNNSVTDGSLIAVDYLQILDQNRSKPALQTQIEALKRFAREKRCILIFISQIDRVFDQNDRERPSLADVRLPNPLDLGLFNKSIFVREERIYT